MKKLLLISITLLFAGLILFVYLSYPFSLSDYKSPVYKDKIGKIKTVLILGNSITQRKAEPQIGWMDSCGMAASCRDSDYVHRLISDIHSKDSTVVIKYKNIADFERGYKGYDLSKLAEFKQPDLLIMRISENVKVVNVYPDNFYKHYDKIIEYINPGMTVITDGFWNKYFVNPQIRQYAKANNLPFIELSDLSKDDTNKAKTFKDEDVAKHPNDKGMRLIEQRIWAYIQLYF